MKNKPLKKNVEKEPALMGSDPSEDESTSGRSLTPGSIVKRILLVLLCLFIICVLGGGIWFYFRYGREILVLREEARLIAASSTKNDFKGSQTSICYYADGSVMQILKGEKDVYYLDYPEIPGYAVNAMLATEDRKFYDHKGYDIYAIARAAKAYIDNDGEIRQGGSTITQQLARLIYLNNERTVSRKVKEIFLAAGLEKKYDKRQILEFYFNNIYFANGYYGIQAAAKGYFSKSIDELSLSEIAFLCAIPNSPSTYDPVVHFDNTMNRRDSVLKQMYENGYIGFDEYEAALAGTITLKRDKGLRNNYEETYTYNCAVRALMQAQGFLTVNSFDDEVSEQIYREQYDEEYTRILRTLYTKGYRIYTSINPVKQQLLQEAIDEELADYTETYGDGVYLMQSAGACIDNDTGFVVAIVGGRSQEMNGYTLNRAYQSPRQPGSSIKPLIVYTPAFEQGYWPETLVIDEKRKDGPRNSGNVYSGIIDIRYAVQVSKNTVAWDLFQKLGIEKGLDKLLKMGFSHIVKRDFVPAAALGGLTWGVTAVEMSSAYAAIENDGMFRSPTCIMRITDAFGNGIVDNTEQYGLYANTVDHEHVYEKNASRIMTDVLKTVMTRGTGRKLALNGHISAGKTGTTNDQKDGWFAGFTKYYTTAIWVGCDLPREVEDLMGNTYPQRIWKAFMDRIHEGMEDLDFEGYSDYRDPDSIYPEWYIDTDGDGIPDSFAPGMIDTDGDGFPDSFPEGWIDTDDDGIPDGYPIGWVDTDGDGIPDDYPPGSFDMDGDGIPDSFPYGWVDNDGDGIPDGYPQEGYSPLIDTDGDGEPDSYPFGWEDFDGDGIPDGYPYGWIDTDGDWIPDSYPPGWVDFDGDGIPDGFPYPEPDAEDDISQGEQTDTDYESIPDGQIDEADENYSDVQTDTDYDNWIPDVKNDTDETVNPEENDKQTGDSNEDNSPDSGASSDSGDGIIWVDPRNKEENDDIVWVFPE
ncbi:MAG: transglycosylase domain-containing protein [Lachnospiraceae bacterium]|nr:transglycosylase domain-containing protein [Lachnospiraceae bacterium]